MAKGLSSGYTPLGAVMVKEEIHATIKNGSGVFVHGHTYGQNPLSTAIGAAVLRYILENGRVVMDGQAKSLRENEDVKEFYLGIAEGKRKSFRNVKHYKRRKRWLA